MGIRFYCPHGHKLNVKEFQAGRRGICPYCGAKILIPTESTRPPSKHSRSEQHSPASGVADITPDLPGEGGAGGRVAGFSAVGGGDAPAAFVSAPAGPAAVATPPAPLGQPAGPIVSAPVASAPVAPAPLVSAPMVSAPAAPTPLVSAPAAPAPMGPAAPAPASALAAPVQPPPPAAPGDPLTEAGEVVWYVRPPSGGQFGPAMTDVMRNWLAEGRVSADSLVWREGWREWQEAGQVFPQLRVEQPLSFLAPAAENPAMLPAAMPRHAKPRRGMEGPQTAVIVALAVAVVFLSAILVWKLLMP